MNGGFRLVKLFGIEITIDPSWIFIFLLVTWSLAIGVFPRLQPGWGPILNWVISISASLLFFASVLTHEFAHSLVAKARGLPIKRITLFLFGGVSNLEREPESPWTEFLMAIVGPLTSIILGFLFILLGGQTIGNLFSTTAVPETAIRQLSPLQTLLFWLGPINIFVGLFNLIPGFPLDGGRILRSIIWGITGNLKLSSRIAAFFGQIFGYFFVLTGIAMIFGIRVPLFGAGIGGLWIAFIGWFLASAAGQSYTQVVLKDLLKGVPVKNLMRQDLTPVAPDISISQLVDGYMIGTDKHVFPVMDNDTFKGLISLEDIQQVPRGEWDKKKVSQIMTPIKTLETVGPEEAASEVFNKITQRDIGQVPVVKNKKLLGMVSRRDILLWSALSKENLQIS